MSTRQPTYLYIPNKTLKQLNKIALKHGKNCVTDDCPVLQDGYDAPVLLALSNMESIGWVRCMIPATPDREHQVCLDIRVADFEALPTTTCTSVNPEGVVEEDSNWSQGGQS